MKTGNEAFYAQYDESKHQYLVLNYDKFSQPYSQERTYDLVQEKIDFVVLDEIQFIRTIQSAIEELKEQGLIIEKIVWRILEGKCICLSNLNGYSYIILHLLYIWLIVMRLNTNWD